MNQTLRLVLPSFPWNQCLLELRAMYSDALGRAGYAITLADTYLKPGEQGEAQQLAFGAHAVPPPPGCVVMQSEHHAAWFTEKYRETLEGAALVVNMGPFDIAGAGLECPPGIMPDAHQANGVRDLDVLFYGSVTPRRAQILSELQRNGIHVTAAYGLFGAARDALIDRAKVVLDLKQVGDEPDDQTRAFWPLSRGAMVLSENAPRGCLARVTPEDAVRAVQICLAQPEWRARLLEQYRTALGPCDVSALCRVVEWP